MSITLRYNGESESVTGQIDRSVGLRRRDATQCVVDLGTCSTKRCNSFRCKIIEGSVRHFYSKLGILFGYKIVDNTLFTIL